MKTGRPKLPLLLTALEQGKLNLIARRPETSQRAALRARIVLACATEPSNQAVARQVGASAMTVGKWRCRFVTGRLAALGDLPRSGPPRTVTDQQVEAVITQTLETKPKAATHWSTRSLARETGLSHDTISRIWRAFGLQPHRQDNFKLTTDPFFVEKVRAIVGLYMSPPARALVLCVDEKSQIQALERIRRNFFRSMPHLRQAIQDYVDAHNQDPKPFHWTASADLIPGKAEHICKKLA
jgi:transposase